MPQSSLRAGPLAAADAGVVAFGEALGFVGAVLGALPALDHFEFVARVAIGRERAVGAGGCAAGQPDRKRRPEGEAALDSPAVSH